MPNLKTYKIMMGLKGNTSAQMRKNDSDMIMENTWNEDLQSRVAYIYDYFHDDEPDKNVDLNPAESKSKVAVDIKFITDSYNTLAKDQVPYHIQFRPSHENPLEYFEDEYVKKYGIEYPLGLFIDIPDIKTGIYRRWLICATANLYEQFSSWSVLPCDYKYQWIYTKNGVRKKYEMWGAQRSQNSYNSGVYLDRIIEKVENQKKALLPYNSISQTLYYNQRLIISAPVDEGIEPTAWRVTKVENNNPIGIMNMTFAQDKFDNLHDYIERDLSGKVIGMWADYYSSTVEPTENVIENQNKTDIYNVITINSLKPQIRVRGSNKILTAKFYNQYNQEQPLYIGDWSFYIDDKDVTELEHNPLEIITSVDDSDLDKNQIKIRFIGDDSYLGKTITVINKFDSIETRFDIAIVAL